MLVLDQFVLELLLEVYAFFAHLRHTINHVHYEVEPIQVVEYRHVERRGDRALFFVSADVDVLVVGAAVGQPVDRPRVRVESEDDGLVGRKQIIEVDIAQTVRVLAFRLQAHQVDDINHANPEVGQMLAHDRNSCQRFQRRHVTAAGHHDVRLCLLVVACPLPDTDALGAMFDRFVHGQPLRRWVFSRDHDIDVVAAAKAVVNH